MERVVDLQKAQEFNQFMGGARECSISARFALAMCFFNDFCSRNEITAISLDDFRDHLWNCPCLLAELGDFQVWYATKDPMVEAALGDRNFPEIACLSAKHYDVSDRFYRLIELTTEMLYVNFWGEDDNEQTFDLLKKIQRQSQSTRLPSLTPFKFSVFAYYDGWGVDMTKQDLSFWRQYSETWMRDQVEMS